MIVPRVNRPPKKHLTMRQLPELVPKRVPRGAERPHLRPPAAVLRRVQDAVEREREASFALARARRGLRQALADSLPWHLTVADVAKRMGVTPAYLYNYLAGRITMRPENVERVLAVLTDDPDVR